MSAPSIVYVVIEDGQRLQVVGVDDTYDRAFKRARAFVDGRRLDPIPNSPDWFDVDGRDDWIIGIRRCALNA